jgi:hypothetical protein
VLRMEFRVQDVVIGEQVGRDRHTVALTLGERRRAGIRIPPVVERAIVADLHLQQLLVVARGLVGGEGSRETLALGLGLGRAARCDGLRVLDRTLTGQRPPPRE